MSDGIKLPDVLKGATEVTSLSSTDRLVAFGSNGELKKITKANAVKKQAYIHGISSPQWVRVASFGGSVGALIAIESIWHNVPGNRILIDCFLHPDSINYNSITTLSQMANAANCLLKKCRVVVKRNSVCYFDIYYDATSQEQVFVKVVQGEYFSTLAEPIAGAEIPEGYTAKEFVFSENFGEVKHYRLICYAILKKGGGLRHERCDENFKRNAEGGSDGCARAASAGGTGLRHVYDAGVCGSRRHVAEPSEGRVQIRRVAGIRPPHVRRPGLLSALNRRRWWCNIFLLESPLRRLFHRPALMGAVEESGRRGHDGHLAGKGVAAA